MEIEDDGSIVSHENGTDMLVLSPVEPAEPVAEEQVAEAAREVDAAGFKAELEAARGDLSLIHI